MRHPGVLKVGKILLVICAGPHNFIVEAVASDVHHVAFHMALNTIRRPVLERLWRFVANKILRAQISRVRVVYKELVHLATVGVERVPRVRVGSRDLE